MRHTNHLWHWLHLGHMLHHFLVNLKNKKH